MARSPDELRKARVPRQAAGQRLDRFLVDAFEGYSRRQIQDVLRTGSIRVNGRRARAGTILGESDVIELPALGSAVAGVERRREERGRLRREVAAPTEVEELYRDDDLLIVSKPPGVPVHGGARLDETQTLLDLLRPDVLAGFGLVHRLDKDTTGAVALVRGEALRAQASERLARADDEGGVAKLYEAIVEGRPVPEGGEIDAPLTTPDRRGRVHVDAYRGRPARTRYVTLESFADASRLQLELLTGRTHQIRAHLAAVGHPLLVDPRYGNRGGWKLPDPRGRLDARLRRTPLHAVRLRMPHPRTGEVVEVQAPMPADMRYALEVLRVDAGRRRGTGGAETER